MPCLREAENKMSKHGAKSSANSLGNLAEMLSGPAALDGSRSCKNLVIPEACKSILEMLGNGDSSKLGNSSLFLSGVKQN